MPILTECPACRAKASIPEGALGRSVRCPGCNYVFLAQDAALPPTPPLAIATAPALAGRSAPVEPVEEAPSRLAPSPPRRSVALTIAVIAGLGMSSLALLLSGVALGVVFFRNPLPGSSVKKYDFSTPKAALTSQLQMEQNKDLRASLEMSTLVEGPKIEEKLKTLDVRKEAEWSGKMVLFVAYEEKGVKKYDTIGFEKDAKTGFWMRRYVSAYDVRKDNPRLADTMESWRARGELNPPERGK